MQFGMSLVFLLGVAQAGRTQVIGLPVASQMKTCPALLTDNQVNQILAESSKEYFDRGTPNFLLPSSSNVLDGSIADPAVMKQIQGGDAGQSLFDVRMHGWVQIMFERCRMWGR
jgi:hypothetical protein